MFAARLLRAQVLRPDLASLGLRRSAQVSPTDPAMASRAGAAELPVRIFAVSATQLADRLRVAAPMPAPTPTAPSALPTALPSALPSVRSSGVRSAPIPALPRDAPWREARAPSANGPVAGGGSEPARAAPIPAVSQLGVALHALAAALQRTPDSTHCASHAAALLAAGQHCEQSMARSAPAGAAAALHAQVQARLCNLLQRLRIPAVWGAAPGLARAPLALLARRRAQQLRCLRAALRLHEGVQQLANMLCREAAPGAVPLRAAHPALLLRATAGAQPNPWIGRELLAPAGVLPAEFQAQTRQFAHPRAQWQRLLLRCPEGTGRALVAKRLLSPVCVPVAQTLHLLLPVALRDAAAARLPRAMLLMAQRALQHGGLTRRGMGSVPAN